MILKDKNYTWIGSMQTIHTLLQVAEHLDSEKYKCLSRQISPTYRPATLTPHLTELKRFTYKERSIIKIQFWG